MKNEHEKFEITDKILRDYEMNFERKEKMDVAIDTIQKLRDKQKAKIPIKTRKLRELKMEKKAVEVLLQAYNKKAGLKIKRIFDNKSHTVKDTDMIDTGRALSTYANTFTNSVRNNQIKIFANQLFGENELDQLLKSFEEFKGKESMVMKQFQNVLAPLILRLLDKFKDYYHGLKIRKAMKRQKSIVSYYRICEENQEDYDKKLLQDPIFGDLRLLHQNYFDKIVNPSRKSSSNSEIVKSNKLSMNSKQKSLYKLNLNIESALHQDLDQATKSLALNKSKSVVTTNVVRDILFKAFRSRLTGNHSKDSSDIKTSEDRKSDDENYDQLFSKSLNDLTNDLDGLKVKFDDSV